MVLIYTDLKLFDIRSKSLENYHCSATNLLNEEALSMRKVSGRELWIGNSSDLSDAPKVLSAGIEAVIELAASEPMAVLPREIIRFRFPLCDGEENPSWLLRLAAETTASLLHNAIPLLICCSAGMSRSVLIAAAGIAKAENRHFAKTLMQVAESGPADVSPALLMQLKAVIDV